MFKNILVPIDGSNPSVRAAELAIDMAKQFDARLTFIYVTRKVPIPAALKRFLQDEDIAGEHMLDISEAMENLVEDLVSKAEGAGIKKVRTEFKEGKPSAVITSTAESEHCDLIVLGRRGVTSIDRLYTGSVANRVAAISPCPVLVVP
jgi:nucleotide-binding universal stress UspA family protein